jgi:hypothetical protein
VTPAQSALCLVQCKQSAAGCRRRAREWRSGRGGRSRLGWFWLLRRPQHFSGGLRRRAGRLKFRENRIGIDRRRRGSSEISGDANDLHRDGHRLEFVQGVGDRETAVGSCYGDRAWRLASWPQRGAGIGSLRRRLELDLYGWRRRLEGVPGKRGTAGKAASRNCNRENTTHDRSATLEHDPETSAPVFREDHAQTRNQSDSALVARPAATVPKVSIRVSPQWCNRTDMNR